MFYSFKCDLVTHSSASDLHLSMIRNDIWMCSVDYLWCYGFDPEHLISLATYFCLFVLGGITGCTQESFLLCIQKLLLAP